MVLFNTHLTVEQELSNLDKDIELCEKLIQEQGEKPELLQLRAKYTELRERLIQNRGN